VKLVLEVYGSGFCACVLIVRYVLFGEDFLDFGIFVRLFMGWRKVRGVHFPRFIIIQVRFLRKLDLKPP